MEYCIYGTDEDYKARMAIDILKENKIIAYSKNMGIQNLFGDSKLFTGSDLIIGEIKIFVKEDDVEKAKQILSNIPFLKNTIKTIENDEIKKDSYSSQRALIFSVCSLFIIPFFFNLEYLIHYLSKRKNYVLLIINSMYFLFSIIMCFNSFDYLKFIWKGNLFFTLAFSIGKWVELHRKKSKLAYLMIIPIIFLILSYNIADQIYGIKIFGG